jgi:hypothetical protein
VILQEYHIRQDHKDRGQRQDKEKKEYRPEYAGPRGQTGLNQIKSNQKNFISHSTA